MKTIFSAQCFVCTRAIFEISNKCRLCVEFGQRWVCVWVCVVLFYAWVCVCMMGWGLYYSVRRQAGRHDVLWVAASLWGWPDLCLQLRFTGQQQMRGVIAWQQHSPSLEVMAHRMHTNDETHTSSHTKMCDCRRAYVYTRMQTCK